MMKIVFKYTGLTAALLLFFSFRMPVANTIRYLPLGDSYTICTGATAKESWPRVMTTHLNEQNFKCDLLDNPARNGYSTQDVILRELPLLKTLKPNFVTLLIGVNDWVQHVPTSTFNDNLVEILDEVQKSLPDKGKVIVMTIPDFGVTPTGKQYSNGRNISDGINLFNNIIKLEAQKRKLPVVDLFELSKQMGRDETLVAKDGLHPSAKEYALWEKLILPEAVKLLK